MTKRLFLLFSLIFLSVNPIYGQVENQSSEFNPLLCLIGLMFIISMFYVLFIAGETRKLPCELWYYYQDYTKIGIVRRLVVWFLWSGGWGSIEIYEKILKSMIKYGILKVDNGKKNLTRRSVIVKYLYLYLLPA